MIAPDRRKAQLFAIDRGPAAGEVEKLGQDGNRGRPWDRQATIGFHAARMPAVILMEEREQGAGINQAVSGHAPSE